jgi:hypothetical protein
VKLEQLKHLKKIFGDRLIEYEFRPICGVYFHIHGGEVTYVGKSTNIFKRTCEWKDSTHPIDAIYYLEVPLEQLRQVEAEMISLCRPNRNWQMNRDGYSIRNLEGPWPIRAALEHSAMQGV